MKVSISVDIPQIRKEYDRCLSLSRNPEKAPELYGLTGPGEVGGYYRARAEGIGWVLDQISTSGRGS